MKFTVTSVDDNVILVRWNAELIDTDNDLNIDSVHVCEIWLLKGNIKCLLQESSTIYFANTDVGTWRSAVDEGHPLPSAFIRDSYQACIADNSTLLKLSASDDDDQISLDFKGRNKDDATFFMLLASIPLKKVSSTKLTSVKSTLLEVWLNQSMTIPRKVEQLEQSLKVSEDTCDKLIKKLESNTRDHLDQIDTLHVKFNALLNSKKEKIAVLMHNGASNSQTATQKASTKKNSSGKRSRAENSSDDDQAMDDADYSGDEVDDDEDDGGDSDVMPVNYSSD